MEYAILLLIPLLIDLSIVILKALQNIWIVNFQVLLVFRVEFFLR